jgi:hypothetical protein
MYVRAADICFDYCELISARINDSGRDQMIGEGNGWMNVNI